MLFKLSKQTTKQKQTKKTQRKQKQKLDIYIYTKNQVFYFFSPISPFETLNVRQSVHFLIHLNFIKSVIGFPKD